MSLYEVLSMRQALEAMDKKSMPKVSDEEWAKAEAMLAAATAGDPSVSIH